jgi:hypothetical protein
MGNQSSFATNAFGETVVRCLGCGGWTTSVDEVCEPCEEQGLSRDLILMEQEFEDSQEPEFNDDFPMSLEYDDDDPRDYDVSYQDDYY